MQHPRIVSDLLTKRYEYNHLIENQYTCKPIPLFDTMETNTCELMTVGDARQLV